MSYMESENISRVSFYFSEEDSERSENLIRAYESLKENGLSDEDGSLKDDVSPNEDGSLKDDDLRRSPPSSDPESGSSHPRVPLRVILIGKNTYQDPAVLEAVRQGILEKCAFLAVRLDNASDVSSSGKEQKGQNPFDYFWFEYSGGRIISGEGITSVPGKFRRLVSSRVIKDRLSEYVPMYDVVRDDGYKNIFIWTEKEIKRMTDFFAECDKIKPEEHPGAIKLSSKGGLGGMFMYAFMERNK